MPAYNQAAQTQMDGLDVRFEPGNVFSQAQQPAPYQHHAIHQQPQPQQPDLMHLQDIHNQHQHQYSNPSQQFSQHQQLEQPLLNSSIQDYQQHSSLMQPCQQQQAQIRLEQDQAIHLQPAYDFHNNTSASHLQLRQHEQHLQQNPLRQQQSHATDQVQMQQDDTIHQQHYQQRQHQLHLHPDKVTDLIEELFIRTQETEKVVKDSSDDFEDFKLKMMERSKIKEIFDQCKQMAESLSTPDIQRQSASVRLSSLMKDKTDLENELRERAFRLAETRQNIIPQQRDILDQITVVQQAVLDQHLAQWQKNQQFSVSDDILNQIQIWVEGLTEITWRLRNQVRGLYYTLISRQNIPVNASLLDELDFLGHSVDRSLEVLTLKTFVVVKQPPQVMKTNTRFSASVRFLAGTKLGVNLIRPTVKVIILSESKARAIIKRHQEIIRSSWCHLDSSHVSNQTSGSSALAAQASINDAKMTNGDIMSQTQSNHAQLSCHLQPSLQQPLHPSMIKTEQQQQTLQANQSTPQTSPAYNQQAPQQPFQQQHHQQYPYQAQQHHQLASHPAQNVARKVLNLNEFEQSGEIVNNAHTLEYQDKQLIALFRNMQLKKIKRAEKKGTESVMDEKFIMLFHTQIRIADSYNDDNSFLTERRNSWITAHDLAFHIMAFSLPVVVIVHGNQEPHAWATITWHNAFAQPDDILYQVPTEVTWENLGKVLSSKFEINCRKPLSKQNLSYLASKIARSRVDSDQILVSWNQFAKESLPGKQFTFWEWFHSILKLTKDHLIKLWSANCIYGFTGKKSCIDLLLGSAQHKPAPIGTFLLRFSETALGGITIAWVSNPSNSVPDENVQILRQNSPTNSSGNILMHVKPFSSKDLSTRSLADRIKDLDDLKYLYPNIPKDDAFQQYYSKSNPQPALPGDYVESVLTTTIVVRPYKTIANASSLNPMECSTVTTSPNSFSQSSPEATMQEGHFMHEIAHNYDSFDPNL